MENNITFSTCWYVFKAKFDANVYEKWMDNMLSNVYNYNLVLYCDNLGYKYVEKYSSNPKIKIIIKPFTDFYTYQYQKEWINNHTKNWLLNEKVDWKVNMLWSEKINFVKETSEKKYFDTEFYGWMDIGYMRCRSNDLDMNILANWPSSSAITNLDSDKIYYANVNNNDYYIHQLHSLIQDKNNLGLPKIPIPPNQVSIAGGFFICHRDIISSWFEEYYAKLEKYFMYGYLVKDDQIIVADCVFSNPDNFCLIKEDDMQYDNWFLFQRKLREPTVPLKPLP